MSFDRLTKLLLVETNEVTSVAIVGDPPTMMIPVSATKLVDALETAVIERCRSGPVSPVAAMDKGDVETLRAFVLRSVRDFEGCGMSNMVNLLGLRLNRGDVHCVPLLLSRFMFLDSCAIN